MKVKVENLQVGDVILPPSREISLWMRRDIEDRGLPESALAMRIIGIKEGRPDKNGRWTVICGEMCEAWHQGKTYAGGKPFNFTFKARPSSLWPVLQSAAVSA